MAKQRRRRWLLLLLITAAALWMLAFVRGGGAVVTGEGRPAEEAARASDSIESRIEAALFTRAEFFGAQAHVPYPTAEARNRLAALADAHPREPKLFLKLAELDEQLGRYPQAAEEMTRYAELAGESREALETLADFWHRRAEFAREAETLEKLFHTVAADERTRVLERLVALAKSQKLESYLQSDFFERVLAEHPSAFPVLASYIDLLAEEGNREAALVALARHRNSFPARWRYFLEKQVTLLEEARRAPEAERVYVEAFDPFWPDEVAQNFYYFLREHDRFRAYGEELQRAFRRHPSDLKLALRLYHYRQSAYEDASSIFARVERARARENLGWQDEELATVARLLIREGEGDTASRFLYTLIARGSLRPGSELRAGVLYQIFELLSDAGRERLALTRGDLSFYTRVATSDPHPGMIGGLLSLVFSDTRPRAHFDEAEETATRLFNRAAAFRIFDAYRKEYPTSPELAQMYLDIVRLYTATDGADVAAAALREFEERYEDAPQYAEVALKLADCYVLAGRYEEERALYRRVMDKLGKARSEEQPLNPPAAPTSEEEEDGGDRPDDEERAARTLPSRTLISEPTEVSPNLIEYPPRSNSGITSAEKKDERAAGYYYAESPKFRDFLSSTARARKADEEGRDARRPAKFSYADVLARAVASLARERKTEAVLALYGEELRKYPAEEWLYEQLLQWLGQTSLFDEQQRVYREALKQFPTEQWRDRFARWLLRRERTREFADYSRELVSLLDDRETESYLSKFISSHSSAKAETPDAQIYLGLYKLAHERFPHNLRFVEGLLHFYRGHADWPAYQTLLAEYYFAAPHLRAQFLSHLASRNELRPRLEEARRKLRDDALGHPSAPPSFAALPYRLFRADAASHLSNYEEAVDAYRELNRLYPHSAAFADKLITLMRSLGQHNRRFLEEAASVAQDLADARPTLALERTRAGEIFAELGDYTRARAEWQQLLAIDAGNPETYLETATLYWDYFQYQEAGEIIERLRRETGNPTAYAFQAGAILEAQGELPRALDEYVSALDEDAPEHARARRRLAVLCKRAGLPEQIAAAYERVRLRQEAGAQASHAGLVLGYARLLGEVGRQEDAARLLLREASGSRDREFLESVRAIFDEAGNAEGKLATLRRLVEISASRREAISSRLQLAAACAHAGDKQAAADALAELVRRFPDNYGVLNETASFYWRLGLNESSLSLLRQSAARADGGFHRTFARKLAARLAELNRTGEARLVLEQLHREDLTHLGVFRELARLYVRTSDAATLRAAYRQTLSAIEHEEGDVKEKRARVEELRAGMIGVFTSLRDYAAAIDEHLEIINRAPEDEEKLDAAIAYARRYGGAQRLLDYYQTTARKAYKNYRWNVVLARIYEAKGDASSAAREYRSAIASQPERADLYAALAEVSLRANDAAAARDALERAAELSNDEPQYVKRLVEVLERMGRREEAAQARTRLPAPIAPPAPQDAAQLFEEAAAARATDREKALTLYRQAFEAFTAEPLKHELRAAEINSYVQAMREKESLHASFLRLWDLRVRFTSEAARESNADAGQMRALVQTLDAALPDAIGSTAARFATGDELAALFRELQTRIEDALRTPDSSAQTLALLQNIAHRAGLPALEEKILVGQKEAAFAARNASLYHARLRSLCDFYTARGNYPRASKLLADEQARDPERDTFEYAQLLAETARLDGDSDAELKALRRYYERPPASSNAATDDPLVARYFEALSEAGAEGRAELLRAVQTPSPHAVQLVNFLLARGETELAHTAIEKLSATTAWKLARHAETSLALRELDARAADYFTRALRSPSIGQLVAQPLPPDAYGSLSETDWFHLADAYGRWLSLASGTQTREAQRWLPARVEERPRDAEAQRELGSWYLEQKDAAHALEHLRLAREQSPAKKEISAALGAALMLAGEQQKAVEEWATLVSGDEPALDDCLLFLETMSAHNLAAEARARLVPLLARRLQVKGLSDYEAEQRFEETQPLIRALAASFRDAGSETKRETDASTVTTEATLSVRAEELRARYFAQLCEAVPDETRLPEFLLEENLIGAKHVGQFYRMLISRSDEFESYDYDYDYTAFLQNAYGTSSVEEAFDHASAFSASVPTTARLKWQQKYLAHLVETGEDGEAARLVASIEKELSGRYARPSWLRLAQARLALRAGQTADALAQLRRFVGAEPSAHLTNVSAPSVERLTEAVACLRSERREAEARQLEQDAYAQQLALEQYELSYFVRLAQLAFARGDGEEGARWLRLSVNLSAEETRDDAAASVAALPSVRAHTDKLPAGEKPEAVQSIDRTEALRLAAETAALYGRFAESIEYRLKLFGENPDDYTNRMELARVLAADGRGEEALSQLESVLADRFAPRTARWQAVRVAPEVAAGGLQEAWSRLTQRLSEAHDAEILAALRARQLMDEGRAREASQLMAGVASENPNPLVNYFAATAAMEGGELEMARERLALTLSPEAEASIREAFGDEAEKAQHKLIRLYLSQKGGERAALKLAEGDRELEATTAKVDARRAGDADETGDPDAATASTDASALSEDALSPSSPPTSYRTLAARGRERHERAIAQLLASLSQAAESTGDLSRAAEFERARLSHLTVERERSECDARLRRLEELQHESAAKRPHGFKIDAPLIARN